MSALRVLGFLSSKWLLLPSEPGSSMILSGNTSLSSTSYSSSSSVSCLFGNLFNLQCWLLKSTPDTTVKYSTPRPCHSQPDLLKLILFITQKLEHSSWMVTNSNLISLQPWTEKWPSHFASIHFLGGPDSSASPVVSQSCRNGPWWSLRWRWRLFAFSTMETSLGRI